MRYISIAATLAAVLAPEALGAITSLSPKVPNPFVVSGWASTIDLSFITSVTLLPTYAYYSLILLA